MYAAQGMPLRLYVHLETLDMVFKASNMRSCLQGCGSFLVRCRLLLYQLPVQQLLQPQFQVTLLSQLLPAYLHSICMCLQLTST